MLPITDHADDILNDPRGIAVINFLFGAQNPQTDYSHPRRVTPTFIKHIPKLLEIFNHSLVDQFNQPVPPIETVCDPRVTLSQRVIYLTQAQTEHHIHSFFDQTPDSWVIHVLYVLRFVLDWYDYGGQVSIRVAQEGYTIFHPNSKSFLDPEFSQD
ncbi:hypothetical protein [Levilactobacillus acidifarinae]|uniref:Uncharacterized protein n=1 Tax=Levilactobacillus acidifarinae DSM 19394 = JCM 15949 TaxID=1423715 RepID=A0A0R1LQP1_9LACO|nr:hypothetical protein [Levilactobacillus acidifarinae]KRK95939.1 hypothetical protein FD25_GL002400 [Levilactobacillus acidifarinae DSM 19394]GEO69243.1 hypothetical protein LAC03_11530 [Levilactobacillus acidifarinae]